MSDKTPESIADEICTNWFKYEKVLPANVLRIWIIQAIAQERAKQQAVETVINQPR